MNSYIQFSLHNRKKVLFFWIVTLSIAAFFAFNLQSALQGSSDIIRDSPSDKVTQTLNKEFKQGSAYQFSVVIESKDIPVDDLRFVNAVRSLEQVLIGDTSVRQVRSFWNTGMPELLGKDRKSALILVAPGADEFFEAENLTTHIRNLAKRAMPGTGFTVKVTGVVAMFHDLNRNSSSDLIDAERVGIPLTLLILLVVFRAPLAALLPLLIAMVSVTVSLAGLYILSHWMPVSVFAQNVVSMIGLGVGIDYSLFTLNRFRQVLANGANPAEAALEATSAVGHALINSGLTVAIGFLSLFLVNAKFLHVLALGGALVVTICLLATLSLLPILLSYFGSLVNWPGKRESRLSSTNYPSQLWADWARSIMRRPWLYILPAALLLAIFIAPVSRLEIWNVGAKDLDAQMEARQGNEMLTRNFQQGWMGPVVLLLESGDSNLWTPERQEAVLALATRLGADQRVAVVSGYPGLLSAIGPARLNVRSQADLPAPLRALAADALSKDDKTGLMVLVTKQPPESTEVKELVAELRGNAWPEFQAAGIRVQIGGATAMVADFDQEMLDGTWRVIPAVLALSFIVLMFLFKSLLIPLKATFLNLLAVLASYGFLIYLFQDGIGAELIGLTPPGGLNSFIVLMLFTVLFGLSMDYEIFLLTHIREEYRLTGNNAASVATGLQRTAGLITSAALIMVCLFGSFGFTGLVATREFGLGLAFAVLLDATLIRVLLVPALMELFGSANWWLPGMGKK